MRKLILFLCLISLSAISQTDSTFTTDRPGVATPPDIIETNTLQLETGLQNERYIGSSNFLLPTSLIRYGLTEKSEFRLSSDYVYNRSVKTITNGFDPLTIGAKIKLLDQNRFSPNLSVMINLTLPIASKYFKPTHIVPSYYLLMSNSFDRFNFCYNYGIMDDITYTNFYSFCTGYSITKSLSTFIEYYGSTNNAGSTNSYIDGGFAYLTKNNLQIDISGSTCLDYKPYFLIGVGITWKIKNKNR